MKALVKFVMDFVKFVPIALAILIGLSLFSDNYAIRYRTIIGEPNQTTGEKLIDNLLKDTGYSGKPFLLCKYFTGFETINKYSPYPNEASGDIKLCPFILKRP